MKKKLRAIFTSLKGRRPPFRFCPLSLYSASNPGGTMGRLFHPSSIVFHLLPPSSHPSLSLFRIISFESTIMGRRGHAGHVFTKVCAPNTKAAWQTGSIPRVVGRRHTTSPVCDIPLSFGWPPGRFVCFPSALPSCSPSHRGDMGGQHPTS